MPRVKWNDKEKRNLPVTGGLYEIKCPLTGHPASVCPCEYCVAERREQEKKKK